MSQAHTKAGVEVEDHEVDVEMELVEVRSSLKSKQAEDQAQQDNQEQIHLETLHLLEALSKFCRPCPKGMLRFAL